VYVFWQFNTFNTLIPFKKIIASNKCIRKNLDIPSKAVSEVGQKIEIISYLVIIHFYIYMFTSRIYIIFAKYNCKYNHNLQCT
jgi:hypothetical protein